MFEFILELFVDFFAPISWGGKRARRRRTERQHAAGETDCAIRLVEGSQTRIIREWMPGIAVLRQAMIVFETVPVPITGAASSQTRTPTGREMWQIDPELTITRLTTPTAIVEFAVPPESLDWALGQLGVSLDEQ